MANEKTLPKGFDIYGMTMQRKTVAAQTDVEDKTFEGDWNPQRVRETLPRGYTLGIGYTVVVFSESSHKSKPCCKMSTKRSAEQQQLHEQGLRLIDQALRLAEATIANKPPSATDILTTESEGKVWAKLLDMSLHSLKNREFSSSFRIGWCMPTPPPMTPATSPSTSGRRTSTPNTRASASLRASAVIGGASPSSSRAATT